MREDKQEPRQAVPNEVVPFRLLICTKAITVVSCIFSSRKPTTHKNMHNKVLNITYCINYKVTWENLKLCLHPNWKSERKPSLKEVAWIMSFLYKLLLPVYTCIYAQKCCKAFLSDQNHISSYLDFMQIEYKSAWGDICDMRYIY